MKYLFISFLIVFFSQARDITPLLRSNNHGDPSSIRIENHEVSFEARGGSKLQNNIDAKKNAQSLFIPDRYKVTVEKNKNNKIHRLTEVSRMKASNSVLKINGTSSILNEDGSINSSTVCESHHLTTKSGGFLWMDTYREGEHYCFTVTPKICNDLFDHFGITQQNAIAKKSDLEQNINKCHQDMGSLLAMMGGLEKKGDEFQKGKYFEALQTAEKNSLESIRKQSTDIGGEKIYSRKSDDIYRTPLQETINFATEGMAFLRLSTNYINECLYLHNNGFFPQIDRERSIRQNQRATAN